MMAPPPHLCLAEELLLLGLNSRGSGLGRAGALGLVAQFPAP
ncbi:hypothetical protein [Streptomyces sp. NBC_00237]|nr:hypothetical protein [Streptomyces sp. NBC_00237]